MLFANKCCAVWRGAAPCPGTLRDLVTCSDWNFGAGNLAVIVLGSSASTRREFLRTQCAEYLFCSLCTCEANPCLCLPSIVFPVCNHRNVRR